MRKDISCFRSVVPVLDDFSCNYLVLDFYVQSEEFNSSFLQNLSCHARGSKVQQLNAVADALNQTRYRFWNLHVSIGC